MEYVRTNTRIPIPKITGLYKRKGGTNVVMKLEKGITLDVVWRELSSIQKEAVIKELYIY